MNQFEEKFKIYRNWRIITYIFIFFDFSLCVVILALDITLTDLNSTKRYLGYSQSLAGSILILLLSISIYFSFEFMILLYIICANLLSIACGVMFLLLELSTDIQYYNGAAPLQPAHTKKWFAIYNVFFICSLTLAAYTIFITFFVYKVRKNIVEMNKKFPNMRKKIKIKTTGITNISESLIKKNDQTSLISDNDNDKSKNIIINFNNNDSKIININIDIKNYNNNDITNNNNNCIDDILSLNKNEENGIMIDNESHHYRSIDNSIHSSKRIRTISSKNFALNSINEEKKQYYATEDNVHYPKNVNSVLTSKEIEKLIEAETPLTNK